MNLFVYEWTAILSIFAVAIQADRVESTGRRVDNDHIR